MSVQQDIDRAIETHCEAHAVYRDARFRVTLGELSGVFEPSEVDRLERALSKVYRVLNEQSESIAAIAAFAEFKAGR